MKEIVKEAKRSRQMEEGKENQKMTVASFVYRQYLASRGIFKFLWRSLRWVLIRVLNDPVCLMPIHERKLRLPLSHALPVYLKTFPFYDRLFHRISIYIHKKYENLICIDVGANIGDSIAAFYKKDEDMFLAIEPNPKFYQLLLKNWNWNKNVTMVPEICSSSNEENRFEIKEKKGTASIISTQNGIQIVKRPLDDIVNSYAFCKSVNVIKIDTDGHDFEVIKGSQETLANLPMVLFECEDFENSNYLRDCLDTLNFLKRCGYNDFLVYDNFGYLMGRYQLADLSPFRNLLFYQLTSKFRYFDILVIKDEDFAPFLNSEFEVFAHNVKNEQLLKATLNLLKG